MKLVEKEKKENEILNRTEYVFEVILSPGEPTPSRKQVTEELKGILGDNFVIKKIDMVGIKCYVYVNHYKNKEDLLKLEPEHLLKRGVEDGQGESS